MLKGALDYIESQPIGEYIIRPSSKGKEFLTITWKFYQKVIAHLLVKEEQRQDQYKPKLILNGNEYESFDEIFERYLAPCNALMESVGNNQKFTKHSMEELEKKLKEEKEKDEKIIPYEFCVTEKAP